MGEIGEKDAVRISGWMLDPKSLAHPRAVYLVADDTPLAPISLDVDRLDVADALELDSVRGFNQAIDRLDLAPGKYHRLQLVGRMDRLPSLYLPEQRRVRIVRAPVQPPEHEDVDSAWIDVELRLSDTAGSAQDGSAPLRIRKPFSLRVQGLARQDLARAFVRLDGPAEAWFPLHIERGCVIDDAVDMHELPPGGYQVTVFSGPDGHRLRPAGWSAIELSAVQWRLPESLTPFYTPSRGVVEQLFDASPRRTRQPSVRGEVRRGGPLFVAGRVPDPTGAIPGAVFASIDGAMPVAMTLEDASDRFAGAIDTAELEPGAHELELRMVPRCGYGYYRAGHFGFTVRQSEDRSEP